MAQAPHHSGRVAATGNRVHGCTGGGEKQDTQNTMGVRAHGPSTSWVTEEESRGADEGMGALVTGRTTRIQGGRQEGSTVGPFLRRVWWERPTKRALSSRSRGRGQQRTTRQRAWATRAPHSPSASLLTPFLTTGMGPGGCCYLNPAHAAKSHRG